MTASLLISTPGAYEGIDNADYHRNPNLLPAPSLSSSGAKLILSRSLFHFWANSPMCEARPAEDDEDSAAKRIGKVAHDMVLLPERWEDHYYVTPEGYVASHTSRWLSINAEVEAVKAKGMSILSWKDYVVARDVVKAIQGSEGAMMALLAGIPEMTLAWQDKETGVWLRARPDWLPYSIINNDGRPRIVTDLKFMDPRNCHPSGWQNAVGEFGYHMSAAFYDDGIKEIYGDYAEAHILLPVEKKYPYYVSLYQIPAADIERGRSQNRIAIRRFADALAKGQSVEHWPGYTADIEQVGLSPAYRRIIDEHGSRGDAAFINAIEGE